MAERWTPIEVAVALSLYQFNVSPGERAERLWKHFGGDCAEPEELLEIMWHRAVNAATELAPPTALVYVKMALARYGMEARQKCRGNGIEWKEGE